MTAENGFEQLVTKPTENGFEQLVTKPTRKKNILDLVLTNNSGIFNLVDVEGGISDHNVIHIDLNLQTFRKRKPKRKLYIRRKADEKGLKEDILNFQKEYLTDTAGTTQEKWDKVERALINSPGKSPDSVIDLIR